MFIVKSTTGNYESALEIANEAVSASGMGKQIRPTSQETGYTRDGRIEYWVFSFHYRKFNATVAVDKIYPHIPTVR